MDPNTVSMCLNQLGQIDKSQVLAASFNLALPLFGGLDGAEGVEELESSNGSEARNLGRFGKRLRLVATLTPHRTSRSIIGQQD